MFGLAAVDAYRAYHDPVSLQVAEGLWNIANPLVIHPEDSARGTHALKSQPIRAICNGGTCCDIYSNLFGWLIRMFPGTTAGGIFTVRNKSCRLFT